MYAGQFFAECSLSDRLEEAYAKTPIPVPYEAARLKDVVRNAHVDLAVKRRGRLKCKAGSRIGDVC
ncbi:hypothetical protein ABIB57_004306 [Devosia sp. UYZn731]